MSRYRSLSSRALAATLLLASLGAAQAADLKIGTRTEPSLDPHFLYIGYNVGFSQHLYDTLVFRDASGKLVPGLATSWEAVEETRWRFHLRKDVKFHDGSPFTADDVVFSFDRIPKVPNNPGTYAGTLKSIVKIEVKDSHTIDFITDSINPMLPNQFPNSFIISRKAAEGKETKDFSSGAAAIGTGPFTFVEYVPGQHVKLKKNPSYWGKSATWDNVDLRIIPNDAARVAALLGGDIDLADFIPPNDVPKLKERKEVIVHTGPSYRTIAVKPNVGLDNPDDVRTKAGAPLGKNPFKDVRVRQALSYGINRELMVERVLSGLAIPASQMVPPGMLGYSEALKNPPYDIAKAKALLAEAGYPDGFAVKLHCTNDRYVNDAKVCQVLGQMLARIGLTPEVITQPASVFFPKNRAPLGQYVLSLGGWGSAGEADNLWTWMHTYDKARGLGVFNSTGWSDKELDGKVAVIQKTIDTAQREKLEQDAMAYAMSRFVVLPLFYQTVVTATRQGFKYVPHINEYTLAMNASRAD